MKKLAFIIVAALLLGSMSCDNSTDDPPTPVVDYTIKYSVVSTGDVVMDTIMYLDADGVEKYVLGEKNFAHSFVKPSTNYHGKMYVSGDVVNGKCAYSLLVEQKDGSYAQMNIDSTSSTISISFKWSAEFSHSEN